MDGTSRLLLLHCRIRIASGQKERSRLVERRIVFVAIPPLLSEILSEVVRDGGRLKLVAQISESDALTERLPRLAPDVVLVGLRAGETDEIGTLVLKLVPSAKVLVLSNDGRDAYLHEVRLHRTVLRDFSLPSLLAALVGPGAPTRD